MSGDHDCDPAAKCIDTDDSFICVCPNGYLDNSPDPIKRPGRFCVGERNECVEGTHQCSPDALCTDTPEGYVCRCKAGFIDFSPNPQNTPGLVCKKEINECEQANLNTCHPDAICIDTAESYKCICKAGFDDLDEFRNPGRQCKKIQRNELCNIGMHDCDKNARCVQEGENNYKCICPGGYKDKSPDPERHPGRVCIPSKRR